MNDPLNDPVLQSLEARLAAHPPKLPAGEHSALLYECAFAAGRQAARRTARQWQVVSGVLAIVLVATALVPLTPRSSPMAAHTPSPTKPEFVQPPHQPGEVNVAAPPSMPLDAWQSNDNADAELAQALDRFRDLDSHLRSLAVTSLAEQLAHD